MPDDLGDWDEEIDRRVMERNTKKLKATLQLSNVMKKLTGDDNNTELVNAIINKLF